MYDFATSGKFGNLLIPQCFPVQNLDNTGLYATYLSFQPQQNGDIRQFEVLSYAVRLPVTFVWKGPKSCMPSNRVLIRDPTRAPAGGKPE